MTSQTPQPLVVVQAPAAGNGSAVASLILGIVAIVVGIIPFFVGLFLSFVPTLLAIIFGIVGITKAQRVQRGMAPSIIGLILGGLTLLLYFVGYGTFW